MVRNKMSATAIISMSGSTGSSMPALKSARCSYNCCRKKLGLMPLVCRCGASFCSGHFPAEEHSCTFDYRAEGLKKLAAAMPRCDGKKVEKL